MRFIPPLNRDTTLFVSGYLETTTAAPRKKSTLYVDLHQRDQGESGDEGGQGGHLLELLRLLLHLPFSVVHASPPHLVHRAKETGQAKKKQPTTATFPRSGQNSPHVKTKTKTKKQRQQTSVPIGTLVRNLANWCFNKYQVRELVGKLADWWQNG